MTTMVALDQRRALKDRLDSLRAAYGDLRGAALIAAMAHDEFPGAFAVVSSFGAESVVLLDMVAAVDPSIPVLFLDTGKLFGETLRYRDRLREQLGLTEVRSFSPDAAEEQAEDANGLLWTRDHDACCALRKVRPMQRALTGFSAWATGRKRFQSGTRSHLPAIEASDGRIKINPLVDYTLEQLNAIIEQKDLPHHPLVADGYLSIGCMPCTRRLREGESYRDGRWAGADKTECGIHIGEGI